MTQAHLALGTRFAPAMVAGSDGNSDSYCTPPEVMEPVHAVSGGVTLDPWTNRYARSHGWVRAETSWTLEDGHDPDLALDPDPWPLVASSFVLGNPPYSGPLPFVERFILEIERAGCWGMILLKTDNRTKWFSRLCDAEAAMVVWRGPVNFYLGGQRVTGNNFASTLYVIDRTTQQAQHHAAMLEHFAVPELAWVYR